MPRSDSSRWWVVLSVAGLSVLVSGCMETFSRAAMTGVMDYVSGSVSSSLTGLLPLDDLIVGFVTDNPVRFW